MIYCDFNATAPCRQPVIDAMLPFFREEFGNPASRHGFGLRALEAVEQAAAQVARRIGAEVDELVFTSGATESNNTVLQGAGRRGLLISRHEHASIYRPARSLGARLTDPAELEEALKGGARLVAFNLACHETGELLTGVPELARRIHAAGALFHLDATQAAGKIPVDVRELDCDFLSFSAHKLGGPKGVGALYIRSGVELPPLIDGGGQQRGRRSGTLNVPGIVGFGAAARLADPARFSSCARDRFEELLAASGLPFELIATDRPRLPGTSLVSLPGEDAGKLVDALYAAGVAASAGSACSGRGSEPSRLLLDLGYPALTAAGAVRFSFGAESSIAEAEEAAAVFIRIIQATNRKGVVDVNAYR